MAAGMVTVAALRHRPRQALLLVVLSARPCRSVGQSFGVARDNRSRRGRMPLTDPGRLVEGQITTNWKQALAQLTLAYPDRIEAA